MFTEFENPIHEGNLKLLDFIKKGIVQHEDWVEECTCDTDYENGCWYRMTDKEQMELRVDSVFRRLTQEVADGFPNLIPTES